PTEASVPPAVTETKIELRPTVGHVEETKSAAQVQTADASGAIPASLSTSATPDAAPAVERAPQSSEAAVSDHGDGSIAATDASASKSEIDPIAAKHGDAAALDEKPARATPIETASDQPAKPEAATVAGEASKPGDTAASATPTELKVKANTEGQGEKPATATATAPVALPAATNETPLKGDIKSDFAKTAASKTDPGFSFKNAGQIAVFVSRKDSKLYVRQNFSPLFNVPVTIAPDARPLGTHIFTAQVDGSDANVLHWSVVSLPAPSRSAGRHAEDERNLRGRRFASAGPIQAKPVPVPDNPAEALDRLNLPAEVMAKIYEAVSTGGSIIVSDQGIAAGETGEGTDFIVSLR
ncbi:MAG: L,D-transpeptidase, partial [Bradyrhizobium sp.]